MDALSGIGIIAPAVAIAASAASCRLLSPAAHRLGWVDRPAARKPHSGDIPLVGGLAVLVPVALGWWFVTPPGARPGWFEACAALMLLTGFLDDRFPISSRTRFFVQIAVCITMSVAGAVVLSDLGQLFTADTLFLGEWSIPVTVFATVGLINAFNMVDGMDGLAGSLFVLIAGALAVCAFLVGRPEAILVALLVGAVLGFLLFNARLPWNPRARVFLGDSGSMFLGFCLAWFTVSLSQGADRAIAPITAVWLCAVPLLDAGSLIIRRFVAGKAPFHGDLSHLHHLFLRAGFTVSQSWALILGLAAGLGGVGLVGEFAGVPEYVRFWVFLGVAVSYHLVVDRAFRSGRFLGRALVELGSSTGPHPQREGSTHASPTPVPRGLTKRTSMDD